MVQTEWIGGREEIWKREEERVEIATAFPIPTAEHVWKFSLRTLVPLEQFELFFS